ncbi:hypothetical protein D3C81_947840 [compost metagenome]
MTRIHLVVRDEGASRHGNPLPRGIEVFEGAIQRQGVDLHPEIGRGLIVTGTKLCPGQHLGLVFLPGTVAPGGRRRPIVVKDGAGTALATYGHRQGLVCLY